MLELKKNKKSKQIVPILFILPALFLISVFIVYPILDNLYLSFHEWKGIYNSPKKFIGLENYLSIFKGDRLWNSLLNSFYFILGGFLLLMPLAFILALLITSNLKFKRLMKLAYFIPVMMGVTAVSLMWVNILNPNYGVLAFLLKLIGKEGFIRDWLATPGSNVLFVVFVNEWMFAGYNMLIFAAGIVSIPNSVIEAATMDGCSYFRRVVHIIIPMCKNSFKVFSVLCITGCIKVFDIIWAMTQGGPSGSSATPGVLLYQMAFQNRMYGRSSAIGIVLVILGLFLTLLVNRFLKTED